MVQEPPHQVRLSSPILEHFIVRGVSHLKQLWVGPLNRHSEWLAQQRFTGTVFFWDMVCWIPQSGPGAAHHPCKLQVEKPVDFPGIQFVFSPSFWILPKDFMEGGLFRGQWVLGHT